MLESHLRQVMAQFKIDDITELMNHTGISRNSINKLYKEIDMESLKLETLIKICDTFNIRLSSLIEYTPDALLEDNSFSPEDLSPEVNEFLFGNIRKNTSVQQLREAYNILKAKSQKNEQNKEEPSND